MDMSAVHDPVTSALHVAASTAAAFNYRDAPGSLSAFENFNNRQTDIPAAGIKV
jgi:hypothetical protein